MSMYTRMTLRKLLSACSILHIAPARVQTELCLPYTKTAASCARKRQARIAFTSAAALAVQLLLPFHPAHAQPGPFAALSGSWSGGGRITLSDGSRERLQCRATYAARGGGSDLDLSLRCASDSYNFNFHGYARYRAGAVTGSWSEATTDAAGQFVGRASGDRISARIAGSNFTASLYITTRGDQQSVSIRSPGSQFSEVSVALRRR